MANTGNKQAVIAYRVDRITGAALDVNGKPVSTSGLKQAVYLLQGTANPDPTLYEVVGYFVAGEIITGNSTEEYRPDDCPVGTMFIEPDRIILDPSGDPVKVTIYSALPWTLTASQGFATASPTSGGQGFTDIEFTPNGTEGQGFFEFTDSTGLKVRIYVIAVNDASIWILTTGFWDMLGFWFNNGIWNY